MRHASMTISTYLHEATRCIDDVFGAGYAIRNPALVAAFVTACAADFHTAMMTAAAQDVAEAVREVRQ
jgi:hypothetical protein